MTVQSTTKPPENPKLGNSSSAKPMRSHSSLQWRAGLHAERDSSITRSAYYHNYILGTCKALIFPSRL